MERIFTKFFEKSISPSAVSIGPEYRFVFVNDAWVRLFGFARHEAIGKSSRELGIDHEPSVTSCIIRQLHDTGSVTGIERALHDKAGREIHVLCNIARMELDGKEYILSSMRDISEQKRAAEDNRKHDARLLEGLTQRERDVLKLAVAGYSNKDIAHRLGISYRTVEVHRSHCIRKLGTRNLLRIAQMLESAHL